MCLTKVHIHFIMEEKRKQTHWSWWRCFLFFWYFCFSPYLHFKMLTSTMAVLWREGVHVSFVLKTLLSVMVAYFLQYEFINILVIQCLQNEGWCKVADITMKLLRFLSSSLTWRCDCNIKQEKFLKLQQWWILTSRYHYLLTPFLTLGMFPR